MLHGCYLPALSTYLPACINLSLSSMGLKTVSGRWPEAFPEILKDCMDVISLYLLDGLPKPPCEVSYGFLFLLYNILKTTFIDSNTFKGNLTGSTSSDVWHSTF